MKPIQKTLIWSSILLFLFTSTAQAESHSIYVSTKGNDAGNGSIEQPLASLKAAQMKARQIRQAGENAEIILEEGLWSLSRPLCFTSDDAGANGATLTVKGAGMGRTVISGGIELPEFQLGDDGVWFVDLQEMMPSGGDIQQLFINGKRTMLARTPNKGYFITGECNETIMDDVASRDETRKGYAVESIIVPQEAAKALEPLAGPDYPDVSVAILHAWDITRRALLSYNPAEQKMYIGGQKQKEWNVLSRKGCSQFYLENNKAFLDTPGEFYYDKQEAVLYYLPLEGQTPQTSKAVIPSARQLVIIEGSSKQRLSDIKFEGISFRHTIFTYDWRGNDPQQAASNSDATIMVDNASGIEFRDCEISYTGNNGIWIRSNCRDCALKSSYLHELGIGAVKIGPLKIPQDGEQVTRNITIDNNILKEGSRMMPTGVGVCLFQASDCNITHNEVADFYYSGMSIGWLWGYEYSPSKRNKVLYNHIHHIGWGVLSDMGGVYTLGPSEGTEVSFNVIHDIYSYEYGGWGLYTDEGSTGIVMEGNLVYNCKSSAFHQHYGKENIIRNNLFINQLRQQMEATRVEDHLSFTFEKNIICYSLGKMYGNRWKEVNFASDRNIYWNFNGEVSFNGSSLADWQKSGKDKHSFVADPGLKNISEGDIRMSNKRALKKIGFVVPDWSNAGVYGSEEWKRLSEFDKARAEEYEETVKAYEVLREQQ